MSQPAGVLHGARKTLALVVLLFFSHLLTPAESISGASSTKAGPQPLVFIDQSNVAPMSYVENGIAKGRNVDFVKAVAETMGRTAEIRNMEMERAQKRFLAGEGDYLLFMSNTPKSRQQYDLSDEIFISHFGFFVRKGYADIHDLSDLRGKRIGVSAGGYPQQFLSQYLEAKLITFNDYVDGFQLLSDGKIDAIATNIWLGAYYIQQNRWKNVVLAGPPFTSVSMSVAVRKGNDKLLSELNTAVRLLKANGTLQRIEEKYEPQEMVFFSRERLHLYLEVSLICFAVLLLAASALWLTALNKQRRVRRQAEERIRWIASALECASDCICIADSGDRILYVNNAFLQTYGYQEHELIGKTSEILRSPETDPKIQAEILPATMRGGWRGEIWNVSKTGRSFPVSLATSLVRDAKGRMIGTIGVARDITEQKNAQKALERSEANYRELVENANDIIFTVDSRGRCLSMNRKGRELTGYDTEELDKIDLRKLIAPEHLQLAWQSLQRVLNGESLAPYEHDILNKQGSRLTLEVGIRSKMEKGSVVAVQGIARDVTVRKHLEAQLRSAQKMDAIGKLAAGVAHDFNNLLSVILWNCESAEPLCSGEPIGANIHGIRSAAERAASLTRQLLAFSRQQVIEPKVLNLNAVVADTEKMLVRMIGEDIELSFRPNEGLGSINADAGQIVQVIMNLAVNARDAMPKGGKLTIEVSNVSFHGEDSQHEVVIPAGEYVLLAVSDSGEGMDKATQARIFEPFFTTKELGKGTGLGLATVYGIVKQSNGFIWVYSEPGEGSTFKVYFPRVDAPALTPAPEKHMSEPMNGTETLLLVEDEVALRELLRQYLSKRGYCVISAADGEEAIALMKSQAQKPKLLITDVVMPGMSGRALADALHEDCPEMSILYLSGYTDEALIRHGTFTPGTSFLQKPFALTDFAAKVREIFDNRHAESLVG